MFWSTEIRSEQLVLSPAVIHRKCVAGDDLVKHKLSPTQTRMKAGRDGEGASINVCLCVRRRERPQVSWRCQRGHFISLKTINYILPLPVHSFVALAQLLGGQLGRRDGYTCFFLAAGEMMEGFSTAYAICAFFIPHIQGFVHDLRCLSIIRRGPGFQSWCKVRWTSSDDRNACE